MPILSGDQIESLLKNTDHNSLVITPILNTDQIGPGSVDLRLSTEFKVSIQTREPLMGIVDRPIETFFQETYRDFGENFVLYPNQLVLGSTFEYIRLPKNVMGLLYTRSSINRLGIQMASIIQPGYAGTLTLELTNKGENAINLVCGMRFVQLLLYLLNEPSNESYLETVFSKYVGHIQPVLSEIKRDTDLDILKKMINH